MGSSTNASAEIKLLRDPSAIIQWSMNTVIYPEGGHPRAAPRTICRRFKDANLRESLAKGHAFMMYTVIPGFKKDWEEACNSAHLRPEVIEQSWDAWAHQQYAVQLMGTPQEKADKKSTYLFQRGCHFDYEPEATPAVKFSPNEVPVLVGGLKKFLQAFTADELAEYLKYGSLVVDGPDGVRWEGKQDVAPQEVDVTLAEKQIAETVKKKRQRKAVILPEPKFDPRSKFSKASIDMTDQAFMFEIQTIKKQYAGASR